MWAEHLLDGPHQPILAWLAAERPITRFQARSSEVYDVVPS
jgi:hypothetical protein